MVREITPEYLRCAAFASCPSLFEVTPVELRCAVAASCPSLFEVTPAELRCALGSCPSLHEVTPEALRCGVSQCPSLFEAPEWQDGAVIVVGKKDIPQALFALMKHKIGEDEFAVVVPKALLQNIKWKDEQSAATQNPVKPPYCDSV
jgi:hypothetical protein